jgi:hypothetical protein
MPRVLRGIFAGFSFGPELAERLRVTNHAVAGAIFFELATVVTGTIFLIRHLSSRLAMLCGGKV